MASVPDRPRAISIPAFSSICAIFVIMFRPFGRTPSAALAILLCLPLAALLLLPFANLVDAAILIGLGCCTPLLLPVMLLAACSLGLDAALMAVFYEVTVETVPEGYWSVHQIVSKDLEHLKHSSTYEDEAALGIMNQWVLAALHKRPLSDLNGSVAARTQAP
jgi:hypothetical protein